MKKTITLIIFFFISIFSFSQNSFWGLQFGMSKEKVKNIIIQKGYTISTNEDNMLKVNNVYFENFLFLRCTLKFENDRLVVCRFALDYKIEDKELFLSIFERLKIKFNKQYGNGEDLYYVNKVKSQGWIINSMKNSGISMMIQTNKPINLFTIIYMENVNKSY